MTPNLRLEAAPPVADRSRPAVSPADRLMVRAQLGREPRGIVAVAARCSCGAPLVVRTSPRLDDGSPFPTHYYLTHPAARKAIGSLESDGVMTEMNQALAADPCLRGAYRAAHDRYLEARGRAGPVPEIEGISAGGMPDRVKCLHALAAQALAQGPGANPFGDQALVLIADQWRPDRCGCTTASGTDASGGGHLGGREGSDGG
ncbi:MAG: DUF501 domain-containing protein [Bifidobacteriaceae bacterium]|jgi:hypothetical protein|nr:DUF501 domain-containing protein [Bifidobacteriaceae bacterium]